MSSSADIDYEQIFPDLLDAIPLPVFMINHTHRIIHCNQRSLGLYKTDMHIIGIQLEQLIPEPAIMQIVDESIQTGKQTQGIYEKPGTDTVWKISVSPLTNQHPTGNIFLHKQDSTGKTVKQVYNHLSSHLSPQHRAQYFAVIVEDMSEARHLQRTQRDFLANISHELRTPLTSVRLLTETLEDVIDTDPDKAQEFVEKIETEVQYLSELVSELLELTSIESGQTMMNIEPIEAERLVREVMARMLPLAQRHRVQLGTEIHAGTNQVAADSKQITRVLVNLVHNAIKFTPSGGSIVIGTAPHLDQQAQCFFVRDTGVGIRAEELPRVFERFYKTDRARTKAGFIGPGGGGTGLGLAIARHVVETHGGRIWAESTIGKGSTFTFTLPSALRMSSS